jgi:hypothetical protein
MICIPAIVQGWILTIATNKDFFPTFGICLFGVFLWLNFIQASSYLAYYLCINVWPHKIIEVKHMLVQ